MDKKFKLEKVLNYRSLRLDIEKAKLAKLYNDELQVEKELTYMNTVIEDKLSEQAEEATKGEFSMAVLYDRFIQRSYIEASYLEKELIIKKRSTYDQQQLVNQAYQDLKIMEKLRDKHKREYIRYLDRLDQHQIDEINITRRKI